MVASSDYGSVSFSLVNTASGVPATIAPLSPASQSATVSTRYAQPLQAQVLDANGNPVTGANVTFSLGSGGGGGAGGSGSGAGSAGASFDSGQSQASALTNSSGIATSPMFTANSVAGKFTAAATTAGDQRAGELPARQPRRQATPAQAGREAASCRRPSAPGTAARSR